MPGAALRTAAFRGHVAILQRLRRWAEEEEITAGALAAAAAGQAMGSGFRGIFWGYQSMQIHLYQ